MKTKLTFCIALLIGWAGIALAQPANDFCANAISVASTSCVSGTTVGADDSWVGSVGCQTGGQHNDVWYTFVATQNQLNINLTSSGLGNNVEFILVESPCGSCACSFQVVGSSCGSAPLVDSIIGLNIGATYFYTISSSGADGGFTSCISNVSAVSRPGQDCATASTVCNQDPFGQPSIASGSGAVNGIGSEEDVDALSCFGSSERQSQWYRFTCSQTGTIEFNINPVVSSDDYDFLLLDITNSGCNLRTGPATVVACNWSGCKGSTGITSSIATEPGVVTSGSGCFGGPAAWIQTPPTIQQCREYLLLVDNFSLTNNGFNFRWGGGSGGMTAEIGPESAGGFAQNMVSNIPCVVDGNSLTNLPCMTYTWNWGDGTTSTGALPPDHSYPGPGPWTITHTVTDANGCEFVSSGTFTCVLAEEQVSLSGNAAAWTSNLVLALPPDFAMLSCEVQHSTDGRTFNPIGMIEDAWANNRDEVTFVHAEPAWGKNYYRMKVGNMNGTTQYSNVVELLFVNEGASLVLLPNPASSAFEAIIQVQDKGVVDLQLFDAQGRLVHSQNTMAEAQGQANFQVDLHGLASGPYLVSVRTPKRHYTRTLIKQ